MSAARVDAVREVPAGGPARRIAEVIFPTASVDYVAGFNAIADEFDARDDQRPSTCAPYCASYLLAPNGFARRDGIDTRREDYLAWLAGTILDVEEERPAAEARRAVASLRLDEAEALRRFPTTFYAWPLPASSDPAEAGTSPTGLARAISLASGGELVTLPIAARRSDGAVVLEPGPMNELFDLLRERLRTWRVHPIANYHSDHLLDPTSPAYDVANLRSESPERVVPLDTWGVGHFAGIGALWRTAAGEPWVLLLDSYKQRGWSGYEPQPLELLRRGLVRQDARDGGMLLVMPREHMDDAARALEGIGMSLRTWGNGSPEPAGWTWQRGR